MTRQSKINSLSAALFLTIPFCSAQEKISYSYNSFLSAVQANNPMSEKAGNAATYGEFQGKAAKGNYDPLLSSDVSSKQFNSNHYFSTVNAEIKQPLYTSQYIKAGYQYGQGLYVDPENSTPAAGMPFLGVEASLLQGLAMDKRRAEVIKSRHYTDYYSAEQKIQMNGLMYSASTTYVEALYIKRTNSLYRYFTNLAEQRLEGIKDLSRVGERPSVDTIEASIFLQGRLLDRQGGEIELSKKMNELLTLSNLADKTAGPGLILSDSLELVYRSALSSMQQAFNKGALANPLITQYQAKQKILETEKRLKREMIKPVLNVSYNFLSNSANASVTAFNTNNYKWGASFSFPLFLRKPRHEFRLAELDAKNNELETENKQNQFAYKRSYLVQALQITTEQIANAEKSAAYSKLLVEAEKLKFMNGESSLFLLNSRENKWLESELKLAEYRLKLVKSFIELVYVNGDAKYELEF